MLFLPCRCALAYPSSAFVSSEVKSSCCFIFCLLSCLTHPQATATQGLSSPPIMPEMLEELQLLLPVGLARLAAAQSSGLRSRDTGPCA